MAETFKFELASVAETEDAVATVRCYESADGATAWTLVDSVSVATLTPDGDGVYTWASSLADSATYHQLVPVSAAGIERAGAVVLPPRPAMPNVVTVYCYTIDAGMGIKAGVQFSAKTKGQTAEAGGAIVVDKGSTTTDASGFASLNIPADAGVFKLALGAASGEVDTTGRAGQVVNLKDLL